MGGAEVTGEKYTVYGTHLHTKYTLTQVRHFLRKHENEIGALKKKLEESVRKVHIVFPRGNLHLCLPNLTSLPQWGGRRSQGKKWHAEEKNRCSTSSMFTDVNGRSESSFQLRT